MCIYIYIYIYINTRPEPNSVTMICDSDTGPTKHDPQRQSLFQVSGSTRSR